MDVISGKPNFDWLFKSEIAIFFFPELYLSTLNSLSSEIT